MSEPDNTFERFTRHFSQIEREIPPLSFERVIDRTHQRARPVLSPLAITAVLVIVGALAIRSFGTESTPSAGGDPSLQPTPLAPSRTIATGPGAWAVACDGASDAECDGVVALYANNLAREGQAIFEASGGRVVLVSRACPTFGGRTARQCWDVRALIPTGSMCMVVAHDASDPRYPAYFEIGGQDGIGRAGGPPSGWPMCVGTA